jgi:hypothetical protein
MMPTSIHKNAAITAFAISLASARLWAELGPLSHHVLAERLDCVTRSLRRNSRHRKRKINQRRFMWDFL